MKAKKQVKAKAKAKAQPRAEETVLMALRTEGPIAQALLNIAAMAGTTPNAVANVLLAVAVMGR